MKQCFVAKLVTTFITRIFEIKIIENEHNVKTGGLILGNKFCSNPNFMIIL
jgi:hypothetical protein